MVFMATLMFLAVCVEHAVSILPSSQPTAALIYPSLVSHASLDHLLHPVYLLIAHTQSPLTQHLRHSYTAVSAPLPCDIHTVSVIQIDKFVIQIDKFLPLFNPFSPLGPPQVNLRSLSASSSALILHRRGFDCGFNMAPLECTLEGGKVQEGLH